jgi:hypothetical protein
MTSNSIIKKNGMQIGLEDIENLLITFVICDYGVKKKRF